MVAWSYGGQNRDGGVSGVVAVLSIFKVMMKIHILGYFTSLARHTLTPNPA